MSDGTTENYIVKDFKLSFKWFDAFNNELKEGDDIVLALRDHGRIKMHSGIILAINNEMLTISYNKWKHGKEVIRKKYFASFPGINRNIENIYKIK